tara:strand:+ start:382 stop:903 length:522 start_codon:yes stop_codon:yes gene_type:complete
MTQPTHTHRSNGGKFKESAQHEGAGPLAGQWLVIYEDLDRGIQSATTQADWLANWRHIAPDDCSICMGTGHDHIKGNKDKPCGHCYGLGKVLESGEAAAEMWDLATVATGIIKQQQRMIAQRDQVLDFPEVRQVLIERKRQHQDRIDDSIARQEQEWRAGKGHGHGGQRYTGD